jgi:L-lactate dehydrogenase complex protein LldE
MIQLKQHQPPQWEYPPYEAGEPVAMFIPCYMDQFFPQIGKSMVRLLTRLGVTLVYPEEQTCCGQPAFNSGYWEQARSVIHHFCKVFGKYRYIVSPSGSCTAMCRVFFGHVDPDPQIVNVGRRVYEFSEFLVHALGVTDLGARFPHRVTLHNACHTRRELGVTEEIFTLLRNVRDLDFVELPNAEECCGFGGTFSVKVPGTSLSMGCTKTENIVKTGAEVVVSADVSCLMHIGGILRRNPEMRHIRSMHLAELLDNAS